MTSLFLNKLLGQAIRNDANFITRYLATSGAQPVQTRVFSHTWVGLEPSKRRFLSVLTKKFCTYEDAEEKAKVKKINLSSPKDIGSVGRKIPHRIIHLFDENGEDQGQIHRADVIKIMDKKNLKLVLLKESADPPVYRLMSGQQIYEERISFRDKQKASSKKGPVQLKELTFTTAIAQHDLDMKIKQIQQWVEMKHHVKVRVQEKAGNEPEKMLELFRRILEAMPEKVTYVSPPRVLKEGRSMAVYRHMSEKELQAHRRMEKETKNTEGQ
ncbi:translation initiation factor IF-3, mitochondrial [Paroedura picta]|uniref:translation initiation factor IF-3, mitochondrial n=1 Tax=Paroedura picta TaxID=143630 RepID=UPI004056E7E7